MSKSNPFAPPQSEVNDVPAPEHAADIASLDVSDGWKVKFHLIQQAGGIKLPRLKALSTGERMKASFNILGFLFGPFYYLSKGMWRKGLALFLVCVAVIIALTVAFELAGLGRFVKPWATVPAQCLPSGQTSTITKRRCLAKTAGGNALDGMRQAAGSAACARCPDENAGTSEIQRGHGMVLKKWQWPPKLRAC